MNGSASSMAMFRMEMGLYREDVMALLKSDYKIQVHR